MRRNPMLLLLPAMLAGAVLLFVLLKALRWMLISSSVLWLLVGLAVGLGIGSLLWGQGGRGKKYKKWRFSR